MTSSRRTWGEQRLGVLAGTISGVLMGAVLPAGVHAQETAAVEQGTLEEVIVTAEKREGDLQRTAIAITALSGDMLEQAAISQPENLNKLVPGLAIGQGGPSNQIYLRGVGSYGTNAFADPAVAFNVDGVYYARIGALGGNFFDLARIEVLKGPQGTLYGRNATGGALNLVSNRPDTDGFSARVGLEAGNYSLKKFNGYVNVPVGDTFAVRLAGQVTDRDGYQTDGYDDDESKSARLMALFEPSDKFSLLLTGTYTNITGQGAAQLPVSAASGYYNNDDPWTGTSVATPPSLIAQATRNGQPPTLFSNGVIYTDGDIDVEVTGLTGQLDWDLGFSTLTFLGNAMSTDNRTVSYGPGFLYSPDESADTWSAELRLSGESGSVSWVGGVYAFNDDQDFTFWVDQGFLFNQTGAQGNLQDDSQAVFGELTFGLGDSARLKVGGRYTQENKTQDGQIFNRQGQTTPCTALGATQVFIGTIAQSIPQAATNGVGVAYPFPYCRDTLTGDKDWDHTDWKVGLEYDVNEDSMLYATVSTGFKAGGFFATGDNAVIENSYEPEEITAYAIGSKNRFAADRVQFNAEAFFWDYENHQESYLAPTNPPFQAFGFITINVPKAEIYGLDLDFTALITDNDQIGIRAQYLHAEYTDFAFNTARPGEFQPPPNGSPGTQPPVTVCDATFVSQGLYNVDCTGQQMPRSPEISLTADYSHTFRFSGGSSLVPSVRVQYMDDYWSAVDYNPLQKQDAFAMWDADLSFYSANDTWSVTAYINNINDEDVYSNSFSHPSGLVFNALRPPQTYGIRLNVNF